MKNMNVHKDSESVSDIASRLKAVIESAVDGIINIDERGMIEFTNPATSKIFGYSNEEMMGQNIKMLMPSPYQEEHDGYIKNYAETRIRKIIGIGREVTGKKKDGTTFPFWLSVSEVKLENSRLFTGIVHDLTEQKKAEHALKALNKDLENVVAERTDKLSDVVNKLLKTNQQLQHEVQERKAAELAMLMSKEDLRRTETLLYEIISNYPEGGISVSDRDFKYVFTGGEVHRMLDTDPKTMIGKRLFPLISQEAWEEVKLQLEKVFKGELLRDYEIPEQIKGHEFAIDAFPLNNNGKDIERIAIFSRHISPLKQKELELQAALKKERELGELKSRFVSTASHEFRTPLSNILSSAGLMVQYKLTEQQDKRDRHFQRIKSSVTHLTGILNDFLSLGRLEEGLVEAQFEEVDFNMFCVEMAEELKPILKKGQHIFIRHSHQAMTFQADKKLLKLILTNLISNASKYSDEGAEIHCVIRREGDNLGFDIIDQGIGIPEEDIKHLFDRFFRASNAVNIAGTGLGLNIVKRYVELMGGTIQFKSTLGKGSTFTVIFNLSNEKNTHH